MTNYQTYEVRIQAHHVLKFLIVVACDADAAQADVRATYGDEVQIYYTRQL